MEAHEYDREKRCKELRQAIQAQRIGRLGWSDYVWHRVMEGLGYGRSLRALDERKLEELYGIIRGYRRERAEGFQYDKQGRYMHYLSKAAGWTEDALRAYMIIHYQKTHWNILEKNERTELIQVLQNNIKETE